MLHEQLLKFRRVGADKLIDLFAVLEDDEGGHSADAKLLRQFGGRVDVELGEVNIWVRLLRPAACHGIISLDQFDR